MRKAIIVPAFCVLLALLLTAGLSMLQASLWVYEDIRIETDAEAAILRDFFLDSRSKGSWGPMARDCHLTCETVILCDQNFAPIPSTQALGLITALSVDILADKPLYGPEEDSPHNSREYRVRCLGYTGTWSATAIHRLTGERFSLSGSWSAPQEWETYYIDRTILPVTND